MLFTRCVPCVYCVHAVCVLFTRCVLCAVCCLHAVCYVLYAIYTLCAVCRVQSSEGEALAQDMACAFYEISASDGGSDITELFHELHREIKRRKMVEGKGRRRSSAQQVRSVFNRVLNKIGNTS